jgi:cytoskeletal protein RodZ
LYAEYLGLDPQPLIKQYREHYAPKVRAPLVVEDETEEKEKRAERRKQTRKRMANVAGKAIKTAAQWSVKHRNLVIGLVVLVLILVTLGQCGNNQPQGEEAQPAEPGSPAAPSAGALVEEPPEPFLSIPGK